MFYKEINPVNAYPTNFQQLNSFQNENSEKKWPTMYVE